MSVEHGFEERDQPKKWSRRRVLQLGSIGVIAGVASMNTGLEGLGFGQSSETHNTGQNSPSTPANKPRQGFPDEEPSKKKEDSKDALPYESGN